MSRDGFVLSAAQAHEIEIAMNREGNGPWTPELVHLLTKGNGLGTVRWYLLEQATIHVKEHFIGCDAQPFVPDGCSVEEHQKGGAFKWDKEAQTNALYLSKGQEGSKHIEGNKLRKKLAKQPTLNANVLDYLLANPHLIPDEWKGKYVCFWGTIYRNRGGDPYVRYLCWVDGRWDWGYNWLSRWSSRNPAAVRAS